MKTIRTGIIGAGKHVVCQARMARNRREAQAMAVAAAALPPEPLMATWGRPLP